MDFKITWLGQAGYMMDFKYCRICVDPYLSDEVEKIEGMKRLVPIPVRPEELDADFILFTHDHLDHFDEMSIRRLTGCPITFIGPGSCMEKLKDCNIRTGILLERYNQVVIGNRIAVRATYACHTRDSIGLLFQDREKCTGGLYMTGDTEYSEVLAEVKKYEPDTMITCINGKLGNMDYGSAARLAGEIGINMAVPCHYGMFADNTENPEKFRTALEGSGILYKELRFMETEVMSL